MALPSLADFLPDCVEEFDAQRIRFQKQIDVDDGFSIRDLHAVNESFRGPSLEGGITAADLAEMPMAVHHSALNHAKRMQRRSQLRATQLRLEQDMTLEQFDDAEPCLNSKQGPKQQPRHFHGSRASTVVEHEQEQRVIASAMRSKHHARKRRLWKRWRQTRLPNGREHKRYGEWFDINASK